MVNPEISVVIRAHNEENNLPHALQSIEEQQGVQPEQFELIVVNNASIDKTGEIAAEFFVNNPQFNGRVIYEAKKGRAQALDRGIREARAEWVALLDGDSEASLTWLSSILAFIRAHPEYVAGTGRVVLKNGPLHHRLLYNHRNLFTFPFASRKKEGWLSGANAWIKRSAYFLVGGVGDLGENIKTDDKVLAIRLRRVGQLAYVPQATVYTDNWLSAKPTYLTHIVEEEFEPTLQATGSEKSLLHKVMGGITPIFAAYDKLKVDLSTHRFPYT